MEIQLIKSTDETKKIACDLIKSFWKEHNGINQNDEVTFDDYSKWTDKGHILYLIKFKGEYVGFSHLGSRGDEIDWLEDLYVHHRYQNRGIGSYVIKQFENMVNQYSKSLYIEVSSRNEKAMKLYRKLGYDCLNTITIRKDFDKKGFEILKKVKINDLDFEVKKVLR